MKIALINPPSQNVENPVKDLLYGCWCQGKRIGGGTFPPLNLLSIASLLEKQNIVKVIDAQAIKLNYNDLVKYLANFNIIIFPTTSFCFLEDVEFLKKIKFINLDIKSIVFGTYPTFYPDACLSSEYIDFGIIGEPEFVIKKTIDRLNQKSPENSQMNEIKGLSYKSNNKIFKSGKALFIENLDELPIPNRDYIKNIYYFNPLVKNREWTTALTSRGCPGACNFCLSPGFYGNEYRFQSPSRMIEEVKYILRNGYKEIFYRDETFSGNKVRLEKFCGIITDENINFDWICNVRIGTVNKNLLNLMRLRGCHYIKIGVESGSQEILNNLHKDITLETIKKTFEWARELKINTHAHMILGAPGDTKLTIKKTMKFIKKLKPSTITFNLFTPFPGTKIFRELESQIKEETNKTSLSFQELLTTPFLSKNYTELNDDYLKRLIPWAYRKFYLRFNYIISQLKELKSVFSLKKIIKSGFNVILFMLNDQEKTSILQNL